MVKTNPKVSVYLQQIFRQKKIIHLTKVLIKEDE